MKNFCMELVWNIDYFVTNKIIVLFTIYYSASCLMINN